MRYSSPGRERLLQSMKLDVCVGGAEANVAVALSRLGEEATVLSALPANALGYAARDELRRHGVDTRNIHWEDGRMGIYYLSPGAVLRPSEVLYDRAGSVFAEWDTEKIDWDSALGDAQLLHITGITPALGAIGARNALRAAQEAVDRGISVSIDGNYRAKLWEAWGGDSAQILHQLFGYATILFADARDLALVLSEPFEGAAIDQFNSAAKAAFDAFPRLERLACTFRDQASADDHALTANMVTRSAHYDAPRYAMTTVVDRIGAGDAFVAAMLHALARGMDDAAALNFALAAAVLKHSIPGDFNLIGGDEIADLVAGKALHVRR